MVSYFSHFFILAISLYQKYISPFLRSRCRFQPTCSQYCIEILQNYKLIKGIWLMTKRILKCHPINQGGFDPIPIKFRNNDN